MSENLPKGPIDTTPIDPTKSVSPHEEGKPSAEEFRSYMAEGTKPGEIPASRQQISPMDLQRNLQSPSAPPTLDQVQTQMKVASGQLGDIKMQLHTKGLKLKHSDKYLIRNKLTSAHEKLRQAAEKAGAENLPALEGFQNKNPIEKFLALVTDGQNQMDEATKMVQEMGEKGDQLNPGDMLYIQIKLQKAAQELEFTSMMLGRAIDMIKTLFNVQI